MSARAACAGRPAHPAEPRRRLAPRLARPTAASVADKLVGIALAGAVLTLGLFMCTVVA